MYLYEQPLSKCIKYRIWCLNRHQTRLCATFLFHFQNMLQPGVQHGRWSPLQDQWLCCSSMPETRSQTFNLNILPDKYRVIFSYRFANKKGIPKGGGSWGGGEVTWISLWPVLVGWGMGDKGGCGERGRSGRGESGEIRQLCLTFIPWKDDPQAYTHIWWEISLPAFKLQFSFHVRMLHLKWKVLQIETFY